MNGNMRLPISALVLAGTLALYAQPAKQKPPSDKTAPKQSTGGYAVTPVLIKDEGCAKDYLRALSLDGLEERKGMAELYDYGCIKKLEHIYLAFAEPVRTVTSGTKKMQIRHVGLMQDIAMEELAAGHPVDTDVNGFVVYGFISEKEFLLLSEDEMKSFIKRTREDKER
jgi:hypothetical protein